MKIVEIDEEKISRKQRPSFFMKIENKIIKINPK